MEDDLFFVSTQMQGAYEDSEIKEAQMIEVDRQKARLSQFKNDSQTRSTSIINKKVPRQKQQLKRKKGSKRIKSLSSHVEELFGNVAQDKRDTQQSILEYFGKKHKIGDILSRLEDGFDGKTKPEVQGRECVDGESFTNRNLIPYQEQEWIEITNAIKDRLPHLSDATKRTLLYVTKKIEEQNSIKADTLERTTQTGEGSMWERASFQPSINLTSDDIRTLYDLKSDAYPREGNSQCSQKVQSQRQSGSLVDPGPDEVSDSCSEPEILLYMTSHQPEPESTVNVPDSFRRVFEPQTQKEKSSDTEVVEDVDVIEISSSKEGEKSHDNFIESVNSVEVRSSPVKDTVGATGTMGTFGTFDNVDTVDELEEYPYDENTFIVSSVRSSPSKSSRVTSRVTTPQKLKQFNMSPLKLTPPKLSLGYESDSVYATARSSVSSPFMEAPKPIKKYRTRVVKVGGDLAFKDGDRHKIRKVYKEVTAAEDVIEASEDEDISIIELSTLIEEDEAPKEMDSVIQVPSSQGPEDRKLQSEERHHFLDSDIFSSQNPVESSKQEPESREEADGDDKYTQMSAKELRETFKEYGFKPVRTKEKMVEVLQNTDKVLNTQTTQLSQSQFNDQIFEVLAEKLTGNYQWLERVNSYEPILIDDLKGFLDSEGVVLETDLLERFCDERGICYTKEKKPKTMV